MLINNKICICMLPCEKMKHVLNVNYFILQNRILYFSAALIPLKGAFLSFELLGSPHPNSCSTLSKFKVTWLLLPNLFFEHYSLCSLWWNTKQSNQTGRLVKFAYCISFTFVKKQFLLSLFIDVKGGNLKFCSFFSSECQKDVLPPFNMPPFLKKKIQTISSAKEL